MNSFMGHPVRDMREKRDRRDWKIAHAILKRRKTRNARHWQTERPCASCYFLLRVLIKAPSFALIFSTLCLRSSAQCCSIYPIRSAIMSCVLSSPEDPFAMYRYRTNSGIVSRSLPSAMLDAIDTADLRIWSLKPKSWLKSPLLETVYTSTANKIASCQTSSSSNRITAIILARDKRD